MKKDSEIIIDDFYKSVRELEKQAKQNKKGEKDAKNNKRTINR